MQHALIEQVHLEIGGTHDIKQFNDWFDIWTLMRNNIKPVIRTINRNPATWTTDTKPIDPKHSFYISLFDEIPLGASYGECVTCKTCFMIEELKSRFWIYEIHTTCPVCRSEWTQWIEFVNAENQVAKS